MEGCHRNYTRWAGDIRVGKCIADLGVRITPEVGFHHEGHDKCAAHMHTCTCTCMDMDMHMLDTCYGACDLSVGGALVARSGLAR